MNGGSPNNGGATNQIGLAGPFGPVANGSLYVTDPSNNRIRGWASIPASLGQPADFVLGQADFTTSTPGTTAGRITLPTACCVTNNALFVADTTNNRVMIFTGS